MTPVNGVNSTNEDEDINIDDLNIDMGSIDTSNPFGSTMHGLVNDLFAALRKSDLDR
jgi:hypothetical protein